MLYNKIDNRNLTIELEYNLDFIVDVAFLAYNREREKRQNWIQKCINKIF